MKKKRMYAFLWGKYVLKFLKVMRLGIYLLLLTTFVVNANVFSQQTRVTLDIKQRSVSEIISELRQVFDYRFLFKGEDLEKCGKKDLKVKNAGVEEVMNQLLQGTGLTWRLEDNVILIKATPQLEMVKVKDEDKVKVIKGWVHDTKKQALPGVTVKVVGTSVGTATNVNGWFTMPMTLKKGILEFSFVGFKNKQVHFSETSDTLRVVLEEDVEALEEVVVTGYQVLKEKSMAGAYSKVNMDDLEFGGGATLEQALQGKVPGMMVLNTSGLTGKRQRVRVRGTSTLLGNAEPVWVVDGIIQEDPLPFSTNDFNNLNQDNMDMIRDFVGGAISWLNPNDIESITVLKDAVSTAIYGVKAANGVIVITTKKGKTGRMAVSYSGNISYSPRLNYNKMELMNSKQRVEVSREAYETNIPLLGTQNIGYAALAKAYRNREISLETFTAEAKQLEKNNTDWFKILFRDAISHNHNVSISGGNESATYHASLGVNQTNNTAKGNDQTQYTGNISVGTHLWENITLGISLAGSISETNAFLGADPFTYASTMNRAIPNTTENGELFFYQHADNGYLFNVVNELQNSSNKNTLSNINASMNLRWQIIDHLSFTTTMGYAFSSSEGESYYTEQSNYIANIRKFNFEEFVPGDMEYQRSVLPHGGELNVSNSKSTSFTWRNQLDFVKVFNGLHAVSLAIGQEMRSARSTGYSNKAYGYMPDRGKVVVNVPPFWLDDKGDIKSVSDLYRVAPSIRDAQDNNLSYYVATSYMFDNRYAFNMSVRGDASNRFGQDRRARFKPVWALGFRWNMAEEHWLADQNIVNDMNFTFSYGFQGNVVTNVSPELIAVIGVDDKNYDYTLTLKDLPAPRLKWEKVQNMDYGISGMLFNRKISFSFNGYYKKTKDMVINNEVPYENGVSSRPINGGQMSNSGWDCSFGFTPVRGKDFILSMGVNMGKVYNKIETELEPKGNWQEAVGGNANKEGYAVSSFWAFRFDGLNPENGGPMFDLSGSELEAAKSDATLYMDYAGKLEPDFTCGLSFSIRYKTLSFSSGFYLSVGNQQFLAPLDRIITNSVPSEYQNMSTEWVDRWRKPGDEKFTNVPSLPNKITSAREIELLGESVNPYKLYANSTIRVVDAWYLRCGSLSLSYTLPEKNLPHFIKNMGFSFFMSNPFQLRSKDFKGRDPEVALGGQPMTRNMGVGINVSF